MKDKTIKAAIYARVSTDSDEQARSLDIQMESIQELCEKNGYKVTKTYEEKAKSGTNIRMRSQFRELMTDCGLDFKQENEGTDQFITTKRIPKYGIIFVKDASRFSRNLAEAIETIKRLIEMQVNVNFVNLAIDTLTDVDWEARLQMAFMMAQNESHNSSRRIKFSLRQRATSQIYNPSKPPYGYKKIRHEDGKVKYKIVEERAEVVRRIFEEYLEHGTYMIVGKLNGEGILTEKGTHWTQKRLTRMLENTAYYGSPRALKTTKINVTDTRRIKTDKDSQISIPDALPAIISKELFEKCQSVRESRTNAGAKMGLHKPTADAFYQKVYCKECGSRFVRHKITAKSHTYLCQSKRLKTGCEVKNISLKSLNEFLKESSIVFDDLNNHSNHGLIVGQLEKGINQRNEIIKELEEEIKWHEEDNKLNFEKMKRAKTEEIEEMFQQSMADNHLAISELKSRIDELNIGVLELLRIDIEEKRKNIDRLRNTKLHLIEDKLEFVGRINVDDEYVEIEYRTPNFEEEFNQFNLLFKGTELEAEYYSGMTWTNKYPRSKEAIQLLQENREEQVWAHEQGHI